MTLWAASVLSLAVALATAVPLSLRTSYRPVVVALAWGLVVDLVVGTPDGWGLALHLARRPWDGTDAALWHLSNALVTSWPMAIAALAWWAFQGPRARTSAAAIAACWAAATMALVARGVAPITRPLKALEIGCVAIGGLAVWLGRRQRGEAPMAVAWLVALQVLVVTLGPYKAGRDPYRHWDLAQVIYAIGFAALAIGQAVAWRRLRPSKAGSPPVGL